MTDRINMAEDRVTVVGAANLSDLDAAPCWRNRWFMRDGRTYWGDLIYPSRCSAERIALDQIERWKLRRWMVADGVRIHIRDFSMCLQLPVGDAP